MFRFLALVAALAAAGWLPGCRRQGDATMDTAEYKKIAAADVLNVGPDRLEEKLSYYAEDARVWDSVMRVMGFSASNTVAGIREVRRFFTWLASLPPVTVRIVNVFGEGNKVAVEWILSGGEGAGQFEIPCANLYEFEKGKIQSVRMQFDSAAFAEIVGKK